MDHSSKKKIIFKEPSDDLEEEAPANINLRKNKLSVVLGEDLSKDSTSSEEDEEFKGVDQQVVEDSKDNDDERDKEIEEVVMKATKYVEEQAMMDMELDVQGKDRSLPLNYLTQFHKL